MKRGFTLIELLVVMAIIGILATITFSQYTSAQVKARDIQRKNDMNTMIKSLVFFSNDYRKIYGEVITDPTKDINNMFRSSSTEKMTGSDGYVYVSNVPKEKFVKTIDAEARNHVNQFCYVENLVSKKFAVFANLENKKDQDCHIYQLTSPPIGCGNFYNYTLTSSNASVADFVTLSPGSTAPPCL